MRIVFEDRGYGYVACYRKGISRVGRNSFAAYLPLDEQFAARNACYDRRLCAAVIIAVARAVFDGNGEFLDFVCESYIVNIERVVYGVEIKFSCCFRSVRRSRIKRHIFKVDADFIPAVSYRFHLTYARRVRNDVDRNRIGKSRRPRSACAAPKRQ